MSEIKDSVGVREADFVGDVYLRNYMVKVYNYMTAGLLVTAFFGWLIANVQPIQQMFFQLVATDNGAYLGLTVFGWIAVIAPLVLVFVINPVLARGNVKGGFALFMLFSAVMGVSIANVLLIYTGASVARVFVITAAMFAATSFYGSATKKDLTSFGSFLFMGLIGIILAMIVNFFLKSPALYYAISIIGVFVFIGLTAYDTQKIKAVYNSADSTSLMQAKAINGALELYLDFINLFIMLIRLIGDRR